MNKIMTDDPSILESMMGDGTSFAEGLMIAIANNPYPQPDAWLQPMCYLLLDISKKLSNLDKGISSIDSVVDKIRDIMVVSIPLQEESVEKK